MARAGLLPCTLKGECKIDFRPPRRLGLIWNVVMQLSNWPFTSTRVILPFLGVALVESCLRMCTSMRDGDRRKGASRTDCSPHFCRLSHSECLCGRLKLGTVHSWHLAHGGSRGHKFCVNQQCLSSAQAHKAIIIVSNNLKLSYL